MNLPKLPKPACSKSGTRQPENLYTEAQMLALQRETVEACAKFCEDNQVNISPRQGRIFLPFTKECCGRHEGMDFADALRNMK
jgi:hypothetical protein